MGAASVLDGAIEDHDGTANMALVIIDPQVDFHEGGSLAVAGATADFPSDFDTFMSPQLSICVLDGSAYARFLSSHGSYHI